jgi:hypothetical protein
MKTSLLTTSAAVVLLAGGAFFALQLANCGEQRPKIEHSKIDIVPSRLSDSDLHLDFAMQWDDASKKLLFDGMAIQHGAEKPAYNRFNGNGTIRGFCFRREMSLAPPPKRPDEYSFDAGTIGDFRVERDRSVHNGRVCFCVEWDDSKERFSIHKASPQPRKEELFMFNTGLGWR